MKKLIFAFVLFFVSLYSYGQQNIIDAFKTSYQAETKGDYAKAVKSLQNVYDANSYEMNLRLGWLTYSQGAFSQSTAYYNKAMKLMPYSVEAKMGAIYPLYALGKVDQVTDLYKQILKINPYYYKALYNLGSIYYSKGQYVQALPMFKKIVDLYPFDHDALLMYAWTNYQLKRNKEAKILFTKTLENSPSDKSAKQGLGLIK